MIWFGGEYYVIQDTSDRSKRLMVIAEADSRVELERYRRDKGYAKCEIYKEQGQNLYRLICQSREVETDAFRQQIPTAAHVQKTP